MTFATERAADSPVAVWRLGDTSGTTAVCSPTTYNGTYNGTFTLNQTAGSIGDSDKCVLLDGSTAYVQIADNAALTPYASGSMSLECLVKPTALLASTQGYWIICKGGDATPTAARYDYALSVGKIGQMTFTIWQGSTAGTTYETITSGPGLMISDAWNHVVVTFNVSTLVMELWINGIKVGSTNVTTGSRTRTTATLRFGRRSDDAANFFKGLIDEFALYNAVLSDARIAAHYAASGAITGIAVGSILTNAASPYVATTLKQKPFTDSIAVRPCPVMDLANYRDYYRNLRDRHYTSTIQSLSGVVFEASLPVARRLILIDRVTGAVVALTKSEPVHGAYSFLGVPNIPSSYAIVALTEDSNPLYNAQIYDWLSPG